MKMTTLIFDTDERYDLNRLFEMAEQADNCGFERLWLGEHLNSKTLWSNPEPLLPVLLGITENIKVGCAGILLRFHQPLRVASAFRLINAMYPGRVDLGLAGGFTSDIVAKLMTGKKIDEIAKVNFYDLVDELCDFYDNEEAHISKGVFVAPPYFNKPEMWLLSLGFNRLNEALKYGLNYSRSIFHAQATNKQNALDELNRFKADFHQKYNKLPHINLAFSGILTENENETRIERVKENKKGSNDFFVTNIIGDASHFKEKIEEYQAYYEIDDFAFFDRTPGIEKRVNNIIALGDTLNLKVPNSPVEST